MTSCSRHILGIRSKVVIRFHPKSLRDYLARVRCRVAPLRGEFSNVVPPETGEYIYELLNRNGPLVEIPQATNA